MSEYYKKALEAAGAKVLVFDSFGSYQGDWWAKIRYQRKTVWVHDYYGSCSGCDSYESEFCYMHESDPGYPEALAKFGARYLDPSEFMTQEQAEEKASQNLSWDMDAAEMLKFIQDNKI